MNKGKKSDQVNDEIIGMSHTYMSGKIITPESLREFISRMKMAYPETDLDENYIFSKLESIHYISVEGESKSLDDYRGHEDWFNPSTNVPLTREYDWHFWNHYRQYLLVKKRWPSKIVDELDNTSSQILSKLEDPFRRGVWDRRGMVMGSVQSGKTANYTALITKAVDSGYKFIVVLAGVHNSLRSQTQYRLNEEFLGYDLAKVQKLTGQEKKIGVGMMFNAHEGVVTLTSSSDMGDFKKNIASQVGIIPSMSGPPIILVIKKHVSIMKNLIDWVRSVSSEPDGKGGRIIKDVPLLVIDDECDYASVNTKRPELDQDGNVIDEWDPTKTNLRIRHLLATFEKSVYVGYTATPYANIFIHKDNIHPRYGDDLFPRSFIVSLPQPSNYIGPDKIFGLDAFEERDIEEISPLPLLRIIDDSEDFIPASHDKNLLIDHLPESLIHAVKSFILACAARMLRKEGTSHNSMLVHVTRYTFVQNQVCDIIKSKLRAFVSRIMSGTDPLDDFRLIWEEDFSETTEDMLTIGYSCAITHSWEDIKSILYDAVKVIKIKEINGQAGDTLEYREAELNAANMDQSGDKLPWNKKGISVIAVGGDKLSRGLTLDGLTISYYLRASRMYDTLMQMGRWFGYRDSYNDLCRIYTSQELSDWYRHIAGATIELRDEIDYMSAIGSTPEEFGLKVRSHPGRLAVTSAGKSRDAELISLSYNNRISETIVFDPRQSDKNKIALINLIKQIGRKCDNENDTKSNRYQWDGVSNDIVLNFLRSYTTHNYAKKIVDPSKIAEYIEKQNINGELIDWSIAIITKADSEHFLNIDGYRIGCIKRTPIKNFSDQISIRRLVNPSDEYSDFSISEIEEAREFDRQQRGINVAENGRPSGIAIRHVRPAQRGLLLIYLPYSKKNGRYGLKNNEVVGFAISFPNSENAVPIEYMVNPVELMNL